ncbi:hypothetical protein BLA6860_05971 [Burkholderia lata]|uniref:DUF4007 family protein n=1 Tax=Burkholderia lata (strain ATCC 17760 / DSM 23089 / LMG 22485 / NCIMB 9086 / R18194 / 383) TaxID=482957 RepID=UPI0014538880|nr:DUF4007 family protein [Burkholderia lata]VWC23995.1 hypothetical protein BLA6860_05971 [Burkholderia lata]
MNPLPPNLTPQFSGHETFPLRQLWLRKAYDAVVADEPPVPKSIFSDEDAIVRFGVGRNMATSIRYWASACDIVTEQDGGYVPTDLATMLFHPETGLDPYCEHPATAWLMHWRIAGTPEKTTTWYFLFNHVVQQIFDRDHIVQALSGTIEENNLRISLATLKRDVECCIRSYVPRLGGDSPEELSEPLLGELGLIQQNAKGTFEFRRGAKRSLPDGVFAYALMEYWQRLQHAGSVMAFDRVAYDYGSPGRVFKLDENAVADRLMALEQLSRGLIQWTEQAGIRQVTRRDAALEDLNTYKYKLLKAAYAKN